jgi:DNA-binding NtrC family response regulator
VQPKLLRLLSERRFTPLGGRERSADVRFVGIAPVDLGARVDAGLFRGDLFFRLEVLAFRLPPLRERRADLPFLIAALLADLGARHGKVALPELSPRSLAWMKLHSWPGNLRELRNCLERALVLSEGGPLEPERPGSRELRPKTLLETEQEEIRKALAYCRGHQGQAADLLGISRKALWEKRKRFGIP